MAKNKSTFFDVSGCIEGFTFVRTRKGKYVRRARGTYKEAACNDKLKSVYKRNGVVNHAAKLLHDAVKTYAPDFKQSNLWQVILKRVRTGKADDLLSLLAPLKGLEIHTRHTLKKLSDAECEVAVDNNVMTYSVRAKCDPDFKDSLRADSYYYELCTLFIDAAGKSLDMETVNSGWLDVAHPKALFEISFEAPAEARYYVVVLKMQGGSGGEDIIDIRATGMRVDAVGRLGG